MRVKSIWISGAFALALLASSNAPAKDVQSGKDMPPATVDADTHQQIVEAQTAEDVGRFSESAHRWTQLAEQGVPEAQAHLGMIYYYGDKGLCVDKTKAIDWLLKAADQKFVGAYRNLAQIYIDDNGALHDPAKGLAWYQKGASLDDGASQEMLAQIFWSGEIVPQDRAKAIHLREKLASQGDVLDAYWLGGTYSDGKYVSPNDKQATYWYLKAANGGLVDAQLALAGLYEKQHNYVEAYQWYALVASRAGKDSNGYTRALFVKNTQAFDDDVNARDAVAAHLTPAQRAKAEKLIAEAKITPFDMPKPRMTAAMLPC